eukprot:GHVH01001264.1.p1 GENE.GHVH01001264.1~~GHVH01001264.1.p1  ORF type:complete len:318 (+),score=38.90 GHVH01001264.1:941-1894(+)
MAPSLLTTYAAWRCVVCSTIGLQRIYDEDTEQEEVSKAMQEIFQIRPPFNCPNLDMQPCLTCTEINLREPFQTPKDYKKLKRAAKAAGEEAPLRQADPLVLPAQLVSFVNNPKHATTYRGFNNGDTFALNEGEGPFQLECFRIGDTRVKRKHLMRYAEKYKDLHWPLCAVTSFSLAKAIKKMRKPDDASDLLAISAIQNRQRESFEKRLDDANKIAEDYQSSAETSQPSIPKAVEIYDKQGCIDKVFAESFEGPPEPLSNYSGGSMTTEYITSAVSHLLQLNEESLARCVERQPVDVSGWIIPVLKDDAMEGSFNAQ